MSALAAFALLFAQERAPNLEAAVDGAIDRGVDFLLASQNRDGSWGSELFEDVAHFDKRNGETALALYTLRKCRVAGDHIAVQRATLFLESGFPTKNYTLSTQILALESLAAPKRTEKRMRALLEALLENRVLNEGVWGYPDHASVLLDLSNTQYVALALRAATHAGLKVPKEIWLEVAHGVFEFQELAPKGVTGIPACGFGYTPGERATPTASMTAAGVSVLAIVEEAAGKSFEPAVQRAIDASQARGVAWLAENFSVDGNPHGTGAWHFYWLYGLERVGALLGVEKIGEHDWYREGAEKLVREQHADGAWRSGGPTPWPPEPLSVANTCFALLFLSRATASASSGEVVASAKSDSWAAEGARDDVWLRASGRAKLALWISGFGPSVVESYGHADGLRIAKVEFLVGGQIVSALDVDASKPWKGERFACQYEFEHDGTFVVEARVHVVLPPELAEPGVPTGVLSSAELTVVARDVSKPWMLEYASADALNVLRSAAPQLSATSELNAWSTAQAACDGFQGTAWLCMPLDREPTLTMTLSKPVRARALVLSHANANARELDRYAHATRVRLSLNDGQQVLERDLTPAVMRKFEIAFDKPLILKKLALTVLDFTGGAEDPKVTGFAELELR